MNESREEALFAFALEKPADKRSAFLEAVCEDDPALRKRLEALLAAHEQPDSVMATRPDEVRPTIQLDLADDPADVAVGLMIGRYKLLEKLGEGGCGVVYVAEQTEPVRRRVALKVIKLGMDTKQVIARFEAERQALAMMDHPNIAKVLDAGTTETPHPVSDHPLPVGRGEGRVGRGEGTAHLSAGRPYFVMELVRGIRITDYCDQNNLTTKERLDLFMKVCQAIQHAHQKGIIHRDIKPSNILVTLHDGVPVPKVIDFGIAKATEGRLTDATVYTQLHQFIGTPAYMSPEQAEMSGLDIDTRSDIYSLGVLLYELLAGSTPFDPKELMASGIDAMRKTIREKEPVSPSTRFATLQGEELTTTAKRRSADTAKLLHQLKGDLDWIVMKCLEKDRARRYETANGLAADLKRHLNNEPVVARPPSAAYRLQKSFRRNKLVFAAATAIAAALILGVIGTTLGLVRAEKQRQAAEAAESEQKKLAEVAVEALNGEKEQRAQANAQARKLSESQQQSQRLLYASDMNLAQQSLKLNNLGRALRLLDRHRPQPGEEDLRGWEWRYLWQLTRSTALFTLTNRPTRGTSISFSPDGTRLAVGWFDGRVDLWDVPGRRLVRALTVREHLPPAHVAFSPIRNLLAATSEPKAVMLYDLDSGQESLLWRAPDQGESMILDLAFSKDGSRVVIYAIYAGSPEKPLDIIWVVNVSSSKVESQLPTPNTGNNFWGHAQLSPDNRRLYLARSERYPNRYTIRCLDLTTDPAQELWQTDRESDRGVTTLALSPDGRMLASGSGFEDPTIRVWDAATGQPLRRLEGHTAWVSDLAFTKDGRRLISAAADQTLRFWDTSTWKETKLLRGHTARVNHVAISEQAHLVASTGQDGNLMLWEEDGKSGAGGYSRLSEELQLKQLMPLDHSRVLLLPQGQPPQLVDLKQDSAAVSLPGIGSSDNVLGGDVWMSWGFGTNIFCHWNGTNQILVSELRGAELIQRGAITLNSGTRPFAVAYQAARQLLAWTDDASSMSVHLASLTSPVRRTELRTDVPGLALLALSKDGNYLWGLTERGDTGRLWNIESGQCVVSIDGIIWDGKEAAGGRVLAVSLARGNDHEIVFYDLAHPDRAPRRVPGEFRSLRMAVSPDGGLVASSTEGGLVRLFDPAKGEWLQDLHGHLMSIGSGVAFSPDGRRLISASGGQEAVKLWDVSTRQELLTLGGTGSLLFVARWSADGDVILVGGPWQAWRAPSWEEIAAAEAKEKTETKQP